MPLSPSKRSLLAGGVLVITITIFLLRNAPAPAEIGFEKTPQSSLSRPPAASRLDRFEEDETAEESAPESKSRLVELEELAARDATQAIAELAGIEDPTLRALAASSIASGWAQSDAPAAAEWVAGLSPESDAALAAEGLVSVWAASAPAACLDWIKLQPSGNLREVALAELAEVWSSNAPEEALARFLELESGADAARGLHSIVSQWALDAPEAAVEAVGQMDVSAQRDELLQAAIFSLATGSPALAWQYSDRFSDPQTVEHVRSVALEAMAETRPQDAIKLAETGGNSEILLAGIARGWAATNLSATKAWLAGLTDQELAGRLLKSLTGEP